ncbi:MAG: hypothetical protein NVSMB27_46200 [Ktedonobacteraceae bacterium]
MAKEEASRAVYQFHILLLKISPAIWRRVLVPSDQNLADFHDTLQILLGWDDTHLHRFLIHGKAYGITQDGGLWFSDDPTQVRLRDLHLRIKERFVYDYDFHAFWQHQIRLEHILPFDSTKTYPMCIGGVRQAKMRRHGQKQISLSPLAKLLPERTAPEFTYLQTKWAAIMSYGRTSELLEDVFPLEKRISTAVLFGHVQQVAARVDDELGDEQCSFIEGCPQEWEKLPEPAEPLIVGIDGGYVHAREGQNRKAGSGNSISARLLNTSWTGSTLPCI